MRFVARGGRAYTMYVHDRPVAVLVNVDGQWFARIPNFGMSGPWVSRSALADSVKTAFPVEEGEESWPTPK